jgi:hypothetical protein
MADDDHSERSFSANVDDEGYNEKVDCDELKEVRKFSPNDATGILSCSQNEVVEISVGDGDGEGEGSSTQENEVQEDNEKNRSTTIARAESQAVYRFKIIVSIVLVVFAVVASVCVYTFITKAEASQFEKKFHEDAIKVMDEIRKSIDNTLIPLDTLAVTLVSEARAKNDTWPFTTPDDFGVRISKILPLMDAHWISLLPVVTPADRQEWEAYASTHDYWVNQSLDVQNTWDLYYGPKNIDWEPVGQIHGDLGPLEANIRYVPYFVVELGEMAHVISFLPISSL